MTIHTDHHATKLSSFVVLVDDVNFIRHDSKLGLCCRRRWLQRAGIQVKSQPKLHCCTSENFTKSALRSKNSTFFSGKGSNKMPLRIHRNTQFHLQTSPGREVIHVHCPFLPPQTSLLYPPMHSPEFQPDLHQCCYCTESYYFFYCGTGDCSLTLVPKRCVIVT